MLWAISTFEFREEAGHDTGPMLFASVRDCYAFECPTQK